MADVRFQVTVCSVGDEFAEDRADLVSAIVGMGHFPVDLNSTGILETEGLEVLDRHLLRTDYLVVLVDPTLEESTAEGRRAIRVVDTAREETVPTVALVRGTIPTFDEDVDLNELNTTERLIAKVQSNTSGRALRYEGQASGLRAVTQLVDLYRRPGWVSGSALPSDLVPEEMARLTRDNAKLRRMVTEQRESTTGDTKEWNKLTDLLKRNRILVPLWEAGATGWTKPVEINLFDFFVRVSPEVSVESSASELAEFIPSGVLELDGEYRNRWPVPSNSVNLWLTDLMALGLVKPSTKTHARKDYNRYWTLTRKGRQFVAHVRREVLELGGHRHVGFTQEFRVVPPPIGPG